MGLRSVEESDEDWERGQQEAANLSATINGILGSYDRKLRPNAGGECLPYCSFGANTYENENTSAFGLHKLTDCGSYSYSSYSLVF